MGPWYSQMTGYFGVVASPLPWAFWSSRVGCCYLWSPETPTLDCWNSVLGLPLPSAGVDAWLSFGRVASHLQLSWVPWMAVSWAIHYLPLAFWGWYYWSLSPSFFKYVLWQKHTETLIFSVSLSHTHPHTLPVLSFWCCASFGCALLQKQQLETRSFLSFFSPPALIDDLEWSVNLTLIERKEKKKEKHSTAPLFSTTADRSGIAADN